MTTYLRESLQRQIWQAWGAGLPVERIARELPTRSVSVWKLIRAQGGIRPPQRRRSVSSLSARERELIGQAVAAGCSLRSIASHLKRAPSTISRELRRNGGAMRYSGLRAEERAWRLARRPKSCLLVRHPQLRALVIHKLLIDWSPEQISGWLPKAYPDDPSMRVSYETIYRSLFVQARGALKLELTAHLRRRQSLRIPHAARQRTSLRSSIPNALSISLRPAEAADRAVPGHWEGDLLCGGTGSQIATLVERRSRFLVLVKVGSKNASEIAQALSNQVRELPLQLRRSLTWDRGIEMARHRDFTLATDMQVYFCDPQSPWQRGSNENTNGLLRQYFPKGQDLSGWTQKELDQFAMRLNQRPRKTLDFSTPAQVFNSSVALTG
jgi:IS30 family transposase